MTKHTPISPDTAPAEHPTLPDHALVPVAPRHDGWTPQRQRAFLEALADSGSVEEAARAVGMSARSAYRLRGRSDARAFTAAWNAALERAIQQLLPTAIDRALNGTARQRWYHGEMIAEERVHSDRLLVWLLEKGEKMLAGGDMRHKISGNWDTVMGALEAGENDPPLLRNHLEYGAWRDPMGEWVTNCPPPPNFDGDESGRLGSDSYERTLMPEEERGLTRRLALIAESDEAVRRRFFGLGPEPGRKKLVPPRDFRDFRKKMSR
ncbi:MAG: hypothetical protein BGP16_11965 [Sphingobium sp. 66-54]|nr:MAG: hypothetical protein BGP16_11965 [Sphingobium sp. 66-54]